MGREAYPSLWRPVSPRLRQSATVMFVTLAASAATPVLAADAADQMNGIGMPILYLAFLLCIVLVTRERLVDAFYVSRGDTATFMCFCAALANMALSVFLYFSTAFNYGLFTTVLAYSMVFLTISGPWELHSKWLLAVYLAWFLFLLGFPTAWGPGIMRATN
ncbi:hypothetical protein LSM04_007196 [Trypanosoma melophagium]|nr:hypothetical protein LSM04_007196 [Trypanosoma melophagium]